jgi:hypothetical protein
MAKTGQIWPEYVVIHLLLTTYDQLLINWSLVRIQAEALFLISGLARRAPLRYNPSDSIINIGFPGGSQFSPAAWLSV